MSYHHFQRIHAGTVPYSNVTECLQLKTAEMSLLYIAEEAVQILKEIGQGTVYMH